MPVEPAVPVEPRQRSSSSRPPTSGRTISESVPPKRTSRRLRPRSSSCNPTVLFHGSALRTTQAVPRRSSQEPSFEDEYPAVCLSYEQTVAVTGTGDLDRLRSADSDSIRRLRPYPPTPADPPTQAGRACRDPLNLVFCFELRALFRLDARIRLALCAVGAKDGAHGKPEDEADEDGRSHGEDDVSPLGVWHAISVTRSLSVHL
jgi:hypothetical protein